MNALAALPITRPIRAAGLTDRLTVAFATAGDARGGLERMIAVLADEAHAPRVEWWAPAGDAASFRLEASAGPARGPRRAIPLGPLGTIVIVDADDLVEVVAQLEPLLRRRWTEERLAAHAELLAARVQALDDFAALVAHELKSPLQRALLADDPVEEIEEALELVDSVLEAVKSEHDGDTWSSPRACLLDAVDDLGGVELDVSTRLPLEFPMPHAALRLVLRNLVSNAIAAGAASLRVSVIVDGAGSTLLVDDDGGGTDYRRGNGIGLTLCSRLVARCGGVLELRRRRQGGTRVRLTVAR
jgi:signal transduction histidine kinase